MSSRVILEARNETNTNTPREKLLALIEELATVVSQAQALGLEFQKVSTFLSVTVSQRINLIPLLLILRPY